MKSAIIIFASIILLLGVTACTTQLRDTSGQLPTTTSTQIGSFKEFASLDAMKSYIALQESSTQASQYLDGAIMPLASGTIENSLSSKSIAMSPNTQGSTSGTDYSQTNIQVSGVDEPDFVKTDGTYIYTIASNYLLIVQNTSIISKIDLSSNNSTYNNVMATNMFVYKNMLVVFFDAYKKSITFSKYDITPYDSYNEYTLVKIYDITNKTNPVTIDEYAISGAYYDSRMINDKVYVLTQDYLNDYVHYPGPQIAHAGTIVMPPIYYFDMPARSYEIFTITSLDASTQEMIDSKSVTLGYGTTLMVSNSSIYIAYQNSDYYCYNYCPNSDNQTRERFMNVVVPLLQGDLKAQVDSIISEHLDNAKEWSRISDVLSSFYSELEQNQTIQQEYEPMFKNISASLADYDTNMMLNNSKTIIQKFSIDDGKIGYAATGEVYGQLQSQFSMDEYNGDLRIATNINLWVPNNHVEYNNIYVLDSNMNIIGSLTNIAQNESIQGVRFDGDKLYLDTYRQVDPFFVIDISNPSLPSVLGYLKMPGYITYLQPISPTIILGIGKNITQTDYGVQSTGVKVALFDVSNFSNPMQISEYEIGISGSDSAALYDHKALMYSATKNILVLPISEVVSRYQTGEYSYDTNIWNGAYILSTTNSSIRLLGKVEHSSQNTQYYWYLQAYVSRSLYIESNLYTLSSKYIKITNLNNMSTIGTIDLPEQHNIMYAAGISNSGIISKEVNVPKVPTTIIGQ